jgi:hypothetical protein
MIDMEKYTNAILWPANLNEAGPDMPREEADVIANRKFLEDNGAVYWDTSAKRKELMGPLAVSPNQNENIYSQPSITVS